jgi:hypothetical protein
MAKKKSTIPDKFEQGFLETLDGRTGIAQAMRERYQAMTDDLGGAERLSYAQRSLVERALWLEYWCAHQERNLAAGKNEAFDVGKWTQAANSLQGIYSKLGLQRVAKTAPGLGELIRRNAEGVPA